MSGRNAGDGRTNESRRFVEAFRDCLRELGYAPGQRISRADFATAVFRSSRRFTASATEEDQTTDASER